jgi:tRNA pseudouridine55 synthase
MARRRRNGRNVHGILLLNKPIGISSNAALQVVKKLFNANKAGHTGSLDQLASGLLPICLGEATKLSGFLLDADKYYQAECALGTTTTTADAEGEILQTRAIDNINKDDIDNAIQKFIGTIEQVPPMYSALKHKGQALYKLARQGKVIERKARSITIYDLKVLNWTKDRLDIEVHCSKGTYIRTLAEDIGEVLGCGAHISALHRFGVGKYRDMFDIATLEDYAKQGLEALDNLLLPMDTILHYPKVILSSDLAYYFKQGQAVQVAKAPTDGFVKLFTDETHFLGLGKILEDGRIAPKRLINL